MAEGCVAGQGLSYDLDFQLEDKLGFVLAAYPAIHCTVHLVTATKCNRQGKNPITMIQCYGTYKRFMYRGCFVAETDMK